MNKNQVKIGQTYNYKSGQYWEGTVTVERIEGNDVIGQFVERPGPAVIGYSDRVYRGPGATGIKNIIGPVSKASLPTASAGVKLKADIVNSGGTFGVEEVLGTPGLYRPLLNYRQKGFGGFLYVSANGTPFYIHKSGVVTPFELANWQNSGVKWAKETGKTVNLILE